MKFIPQMEPLFGAEERAAIDRYFEEGGFITEYKRTAELERRIAEFVGARECVMVNNGTISLTLIGWVLGLRAGDEVIVPNFTMIASATSFVLLGCRPVFVDVEPSTLCLDLTKIEEAITPRTKAIVLVAANGRYPRAGIDAFVELARRRGLLLIEDAAQALGSYYPDGRHIGTVGIAGSFSFSAPKIISTGQGGCVVTNDADVAAALRRAKDFGRSGGGNDIHTTIGFNFKFTELQACVGLEQMKKLPYRIRRKKEIAQRYRDGLIGQPGIELFEHDLRWTTPWFIEICAERRAEVAAALKERGIGTRPMYPPINRQDCFNVPGSYPVSEKIGRAGIWLPSAIQLTDEDVDRVVQGIRDVL